MDRNFAEAEKRFQEMYFANSPLYSEDQFRRRFRMGKPLFQRILTEVQNSEDLFFHQRRDAVGKLGIAPGINLAFICAVHFK